MVFVVSVLGLVGCSEENKAQENINNSRNTPTTRWYSQEQLFNGNRLYQANCAQCHQADASGTKEWRKRDVNNKYPPPPLNGTAHTWHHSLSVLRKIIEDGGVPIGGSMPGFVNKLNKQEIDAILAWVQSHWSDQIYSAWQKRNEQGGQ